MYKDFLRLLEKATGRSEYVIAVNLDIRGFTPFCQNVESVQVATYITKIYSKIIQDYFKNASFYKPTGDGLIVIIPFAEEGLERVINVTMNSCLDLLENFGSLCDDEPMVNFPTPDKIGIGLTRGSACCIISKEEDEILDYSGRILNLASRLMDLARPSGIVFDESFGIDLLPDEVKGFFLEDTVYVRGVAEETPIKVFYTKKHTLIPDSYKQPLREPKWQTDVYNYAFKTLKRVDKMFSLDLSKEPLDESKISVITSHVHPLDEMLSVVYEKDIDDKIIKHRKKGNIHFIEWDIQRLKKQIEESEITEDTNIKIEIVYPVK